MFLDYFFFLAEAQTSRNFETVLESANISMNILWLKYLKYHFHQDDILVVSSDGARVEALTARVYVIKFNFREKNAFVSGLLFHQSKLCARSEYTSVASEPTNVISP